IYGVENDQEMLVTVCQLAMPSHALPAPLRISCVDPKASYSVRIVEMPNTSFQLMKHRPEWIGKTIRLSGDNLREIGLTLPILDPESALILH
ncbi:alpha-galactosidase, partial [Vibrio campbellii]